ncbi:hypothetical protein [Antrihabitans spumae]|uniref:Uncharacterized protein n=1 Tax=Antrihabitans spumae TaxID=3373370 RepID=A0ABW7JYE0_9NOCA
MSAPSATLAVWASSWLAGTSAPDDVLEALGTWAPNTLVLASDPGVAARTGLPWPEPERTGATTLLKTIREALASQSSEMRILFPVPGDVRGLPTGTPFATEAIEAGEGLLVGEPGRRGTGLVPGWTDDDTLCWTVHDVPITDVRSNELTLGEAEFAMREAVRAAADALSKLASVTSQSRDEDPRDAIEDELAEYTRHPYPPSVTPRALRVLDSADQVAAILTVAQRGPAMDALTATIDTARQDQLRPLWDAVRSARLAALDSCLRSGVRRA